MSAELANDPVRHARWASSILNQPTIPGAYRVLDHWSSINTKALLGKERRMNLEGPAWRIIVGGHQRAAIIPSISSCGLIPTSAETIACAESQPFSGPNALVYKEL